MIPVDAPKNERFVVARTLINQLRETKLWYDYEIRNVALEYGVLAGVGSTITLADVLHQSGTKFAIDTLSQRCDCLRTIAPKLPIWVLCERLSAESEKKIRYDLLAKVDNDVKAFGMDAETQLSAATILALIKKHHVAGTVNRAIWYKQGEWSAVEARLLADHSGVNVRQAAYFLRSSDFDSIMAYAERVRYIAKNVNSNVKKFGETSWSEFFNTYLRVADTPKTVEPIIHLIKSGHFGDIVNYHIYRPRSSNRAFTSDELEKIAQAISGIDDYTPYVDNMYCVSLHTLRTSDIAKIPPKYLQIMSTHKSNPIIMDRDKVHENVAADARAYSNIIGIIVRAIGRDDLGDIPNIIEIINEFGAQRAIFEHMGEIVSEIMDLHPKMADTKIAALYYWLFKRNPETMRIVYTYTGTMLKFCNDEPSVIAEMRAYLDSLYGKLASETQQGLVYPRITQQSTAHQPTQASPQPSSPPQPLTPYQHTPRYSDHFDTPIGSPTTPETMSDSDSDPEEMTIVDMSAPERTDYLGMDCGELFVLYRWLPIIMYYTSSRFEYHPRTSRVLALVIDPVIAYDALAMFDLDKTSDSLLDATLPLLAGNYSTTAISKPIARILRGCNTMYEIQYIEAGVDIPPQPKSLNSIIANANAWLVRNSAVINEYKEKLLMYFNGYAIGPTEMSLDVETSTTTKQTSTSMPMDVV